ncbi:MAG TPA: nickel pincer cofactor biosynthesis protein LarC [Gemmatimonadaceae bacterium]|nr:nickel pincer cofactor biosynthesis protein LarC [Gemmatimonadaceae bacterium]
MPIAILDPFSGISGDMTLGALVAVGLEPAWLEALPATLGLEDVRVRIQEVIRGEIVCQKVEFDIPPQPHGRHIAEIRRLVAAAGVPPAVRERADRVFTAIASAEAEIHGMSPDEVHLHEVGAVDAILDVVGAVWGMERLGITEVFCGPLSVGDGFVRAAHGELPVPAPATLKLLEGLHVRPGPEGAGELVTPTGAGLVRVLSSGPPPAEYVPLRSGFGAGSRNPVGRANALRIVLAEHVPAARPSLAGAESGAAGRESLVLLAADVDDMTGEHLALVADQLRARGALDVVLLSLHMKKGRPGTRIEVLAGAADADALERELLQGTSTIGVRRHAVVRRALPRRTASVTVLGHEIRLKVVTLPDGAERAKPESDDVARVARELRRGVTEVTNLAFAAWSSSPPARNADGCVV